MKKILIALPLILTCFLGKVYAQPTHNHNEYDGVGLGPIIPLLLNITVGYQQGFSAKSPNLRGAFDANLTLVVLNMGYSHQQHYGSNGYIGLGLGTMLQAQYGFGFNEKKRIGRLRSDIPLGLMFSSEDAVLNAVSVGVFAERDFQNISRGNTFGFSLTCGLTSILIAASK